MSQKSKQKPYIYTCLGCSKNMYSKAEKDNHVCKEKIDESEKRRLLTELTSLEKRIVSIKERIIEIESKEKELGIEKQKKKSKKATTSKKKVEKEVKKQEVEENQKEELELNI